MVKRVIHMLVDDIDGKDADQTIKFALDGAEYVIDLSNANAAKLREAIGPYVAAGTKLGRVATRVVPQQRAATYRRTELAPAGRTQAELNAKIRAWAQANGIAVSDRGRIKQEIVDRYNADNGQ